MNEEKDLIIAMELEKLQIENQQLKEKYLKAVADYETTKSELYQLKSTLEEIREYINFLAIATQGIKEELLDKCVMGMVKFNQTMWGKEILELIDKGVNYEIL